MKENSELQTTSISKANSVEEIADFWDTHSPADYEDQTHEVEFNVRAERRHRITITPDLYEKIEMQARLKGIMPETLVNVWLAERVQSL